jgi:hypothetical protein
MAATAQAVRKLEPPADDIMDMHSDSGLDFDDGDIDLDIDPAPPVQPEDDDISLKDATTDVVLDTQTVTAEQDDYMIDHEDYDEGDIQLGDAMNDDEASAGYTGTAPQQSPAPVDDDLIDYSDDDDDYAQPQVQQGSPAQEMTQPGATQDVDQVVGTEIIATEIQVPESAQVEDSTKFEDHDSGEDHTADQTSFQEQQYDGEFELQNDVEYDTDGDTGGVPLQEVEAQTNVSEHQQDEHDEQRSLESHPITVNYEGNELWLFKQHDAEDSGDWLIDGTSVLHSSLSDLFQACRTSLGEDISNETELGLRFDHFHNMELYEDSTACVAVSLERLLDLYYTLHAQDGESEPESFYMCLLSRPRFASLLSDVAKHAEQGSGYSGLTSAIAAGETHFVDAFSGHSTEHEGTDWEPEEEEQEVEEHGQAENDEEEEGQVGTGTATEAAPEVDSAEHEDEGSEAAESNASAHSPSRDETKPDGDESAAATPSGRQSHHGNSPAGQQNINHTGETALHDDLAKQAAEQLANDTVDYSDDEDDEPQAGAPVNDSPSSATVQGDHPSTDEAAVDSTEHEEDDEAGHHNEAQAAEQEDYDDHTQNEGQETNDDLAQNEDQVEPEVNVESYPDYAQTYDQDAPFQEYQETYPTEPDFDGFTNQDYTGYEYQDLDQQLQNDFIGGGDVNGTDVGESTNAANEFAGDDDFLDLDNAAEWGIDLESTTKVFGDDIYAHDEALARHEEEEDGVVEQPAVAASSAADPVAASSTDLQNSSPQGQKRSIDEVGDSVGDAIDLTGMPQDPWLQSCFRDADTVVPDTKRPRV